MDIKLAFNSRGNVEGRLQADGMRHYGNTGLHEGTEKAVLGR